MVRISTRVAGLRADDPPGRLDPVEHGHADVHQHDVGPQAPRLGDRVLAVGRLADDRHLRLALEDLAQPDAHERLVVGDQDASSSDRQQDADGEAAARAAAGVEAAAVERDPLAHADEPVAAARDAAAGLAGAVVDDLELERVAPVADVDAWRARRRRA